MLQPIPNGQRLEEPVLGGIHPFCDGLHGIGW
jgi:hypothetical protein